MATIVGKEENFTELARNLILLENDAIAAYDSTIERLSDPDAISRIMSSGKALSDEQRHRDWSAGIPPPRAVTPRYVEGSHPYRAVAWFRCR